MMNKNTLAVAALFKNESHGIREWIQHYLHHGVDHFYLIDDGSTDDYLPQIQDFIDKELVHLFVVENWSRYIGRQREMYNTFILPRLKESLWWLIVDMDEYVWCPQHLDLKVHLNELNNIGQVQIESMYFGSNGYIKQPDHIVESFTKRRLEVSSGHTKYFLTSAFEFTSLNVHYATFAKQKEEKHNFLYLSHDYYIINHYCCCQSREFWKTVKCTRGDGDNYSEADFAYYDINEVEDLRLALQNRGGLP